MDQDIFYKLLFVLPLLTESRLMNGTSSGISQYLSELYRLYSQSKYIHPAADVIRGLAPSKIVRVSMTNESTSPDNRIYDLLFNLSNVPLEQEILVMTQLRFYKTASQGIPSPRRLTVQSYISGQEDSTMRLAGDKKILHRLESGWDDLDVTPIILACKDNCLTSDRHWFRIKLDRIKRPELGDAELDLVMETDNDRAPFLLVSSNVKHETTLRIQPAIPQTPGERQEFQRFHQPPLTNSSLVESVPTAGERKERRRWRKRRPRRSAGGKRCRNRCKRKTMEVNFGKLNYSWIIQPHSYQAYMCVGCCDLPLTTHMNPSMHAILQTLLRIVDVNKRGSRVKSVCCAPTRLESMPMLYEERNGVITYVYRYEGMVVAECGCK